MPEYLSPGVYIEEVPPRLRAIEGVSTSTVGFIGEALRGSVPGWTPDFNVPTGVELDIQPDDAPVLVTSFPEYRRRFGAPPANPRPYRYLGQAVRGFFDNGGKRAFIARAIPEGAQAAEWQIDRGIAYRLMRDLRDGEVTVYLDSLRNIDRHTLLSFVRADGSIAAGPIPVNAYDTMAGSVDLEWAPGALSAAQVRARPVDFISVHRLPVLVNSGDTEVILDSVDGIENGTQLVFISLENGDPVSGLIEVSAVDADAIHGPTVTLGPGVLGLDPPTDYLAVAINNLYQLDADVGENQTAITLTSVDGLVDLASELTFIGLNGEPVAGPIRVTGIDNTTSPPTVTLAAGPGVDLGATNTAAIANTVNLYTLSATVSDANATEITLTSVSGLTEQVSELTFIQRSNGEAVAGPIRVTGIDSSTASPTVTLAAAPGVTLNSTAVVAVAHEGLRGPIFWARNPGSWGADLRVDIRNSDPPPVAVTATIDNLESSHLTVASTVNFYVGAIVYIDNGAGTRHERVVTGIPSADTLQLNAPVAHVSLQGYAQPAEIDILVEDRSTRITETFRKLSWNGNPDPSIRRRHYSTVINNRSTLAWVQPPWAVSPPVGTESPPGSANQPMPTHGFAQGPTEPGLGSDGTASDLSHILGVDNGPGQRSGIHALQDIDDISIIAAPGFTDQQVQQALITQAEGMRYRFAVLDGTAEPGPGAVVNDILRHRNEYDSSYAAYYTPWVQIGEDERLLFLPPSGHVAGIYARSDTERGVHKAPANEVVRNITGLRSHITNGEQEILNPRGVNVIRQFEGRGRRVWGARTLSSDPALRYVSTRRFLIFLEKSIDRGTQWVVFEPNNPDTWSRVMDSVSAFLHTQWRAGALLGRTPEQAFFVRCDESTMTADDIENGRLICEIGIAIVKPAEFVIFRIEQIAAFGEMT